MTTFNDREKAYEAKLIHDEELKFKAIVRRNKWLGLWAATKLGMDALAADEYAAEVVVAEFDGDDSVFNKLRNDFAAADIKISDHQIRREMDELLAQAKQKVMTLV
jgi:hypothetical protein